MDVDISYFWICFSLPLYAAMAVLQFWKQNKCQQMPPLQHWYNFFCLPTAWHIWHIPPLPLHIRSIFIVVVNPFWRAVHHPIMHLFIPILRKLYSWTVIVMCSLTSFSLPMIIGSEKLVCGIFFILLQVCQRYLFCYLMLSAEAIIPILCGVVVTLPHRNSVDLGSIPKVGCLDPGFRGFPGDDPLGL